MGGSESRTYLFLITKWRAIFHLVAPRPGNTGECTRRRKRGSEKCGRSNSQSAGGKERVFSKGRR
jgi:hypothetical protein